MAGSSLALSVVEKLLGVATPHVETALREVLARAQKANELPGAVMTIDMLRGDVDRLKSALGEIAALGEQCEECDCGEAKMATHVVATHPISGMPFFVCAEHAEEAREGTGWDRPLEVEEHEQDTAVTIALAALRVSDAKGGHRG